MRTLGEWERFLLLSNFDSIRKIGTVEGNLMFADAIQFISGGRRYGKGQKEVDLLEWCLMI